VRECIRIYCTRCLVLFYTACSAPSAQIVTATSDAAVLRRYYCTLVLSTSPACLGQIRRKSRNHSTRNGRDGRGLGMKQWQLVFTEIYNKYGAAVKVRRPSMTREHFKAILEIWIYRSRIRWASLILPRFCLERRDRP
jgi:hypothetical protein